MKNIKKHIIIKPGLIKALAGNMAVRAMAFYPFIILGQEEDRNCKRLINHETIHLQQQRELLIIPFYLWYFIEYMIRWIITGNRELAYRRICFEREAYNNQYNLNYLENRKLFSFIKYL